MNSEPSYIRALQTIGVVCLLIAVILAISTPSLLESSKNAIFQTFRNKWIIIVVVILGLSYFPLGFRIYKNSEK